jgi:HSP90 family molecular chaperone
MKSGQKDIFYLTGSSKEQLEKSPFLEQLTKKNYEVCFCVAPFSSHTVQPSIAQCSEGSRLLIVICEMDTLTMG